MAGKYDYGSLKVAHIGIQWKGVYACFDFYCDCGISTHYDGYNAYAIKCPHCGTCYDMPYSIPLNPFSGVMELVVTSDDDNGNISRWKEEGTE